MARYFSIFFFSLFIFLTPHFAAAADESVIGTILEVEGSASVTPAVGQSATAAVNTPVHLNDVVQTAAASRVFILFIDNTQLTLSENTQVRVDNYVFDPDNNRDNKAAYSVLQGAFQYVSGLIGKKENPDVHIDTPVGSIGIRGTDFLAGTLDNQYNVAVNEGRVALKTDAGEEVVNKGEGTSVQDRHSKPAHAAAWSREKFERVSSTVHLQRQDLVRQRIQKIQRRQIRLRQRYMAERRTGRENRPALRGGNRRFNQRQKQSRHAQRQHRQKNDKNN